MKFWLAVMLCCLPLGAQDLSLVIHDANGSNPDVALSSSYSFPDTPQGGSSSLVIRVTNASSHAIQVANIYVGTSSGSPTLSPSFTVTGLYLNKLLGANSTNAEDFTLSFTPSSVASATGFLQATYQIQQNGCSFTSNDPATQCPSNTTTISTLSGSALAPQWLVSTVSGASNSVLQPSSETPISFGNVSVSSSSSLSFKVTNASAAAIASPAVALVTQVFGSTAFSLDTSTLPATLPAGGSGSFTVKFQPGQTGLTSATLTVGGLPYLIAGTGVVVADIDALQIFYVDSTGVRTLPQAATPIDFGQLVSAGGASSTLTFTVANPTTSFDPVTVPAITATGASFALSGVPAMPASIAPGSSITFKGTFTPPSSGSYNGTLAIGSRAFSLKGLGIVSSLPDITMQVDANPLLSNQQAHLSINLESPSTVDAIGQLAMVFQSLNANISDDPTIQFLATSSRNLQVNVAKGSSTATIEGSSPITFQTGTTAGTLTLTLTFVDKAPITQTFTITPAQISITSASAVRHDPNLVITLTGFDNTYSAGHMTFSFFDAAGKAIVGSPMSVDATSSFHNYFFTNDTAGGAFSLQATFPVTGSVLDIGSVTVGLANSTGTATTTQTFK